MAPISCPRKPEKEAVEMQPTSNLVCVKAEQSQEEPFKAVRNSRIMRCSSVGSEEGQSVLSDSKLARSIFSVKATASDSSLFAFCNTLNTEVWPGVSSGLDEDERRKRKVCLEPEEKKRAVENDDDSSTSEIESSLFEYASSEKYTLKTGIQIELKNAKFGKCFLV